MVQQVDHFLEGTLWHEAEQQGEQAVRYRVDWQVDGYRIIDTTDGGVVYSNLLGTRATELLCEKMNEIDALITERKTLLKERDALFVLCKECDAEQDERDVVEDCPHRIREKDAHVGNPTCDHCLVVDRCGEVLPF